MGFFSKIWKGIKKTVKKIGKGIKGAFKKFGKFMGKIGILGQVAMMFLMPYVGAALGGLWTGIAGQTAAQATAAAAGATATAGAITTGATAAAAAATGAATAATTAAGIAAGTTAVTASATGLIGYTGALSGVANAAGKVMQFVGNTVSKVGNVFSNITKGVTDTLGNFAKTASNNMFGTSFDAASTFFGPGDSAFGRSFGEGSRFRGLTTSSSVFDAKAAARKVEFSKSQLKAVDKTVADALGGGAFGSPNPVSAPRVPAGIDVAGVTRDALEGGAFGSPTALVPSQTSLLAETNISPLGTIIDTTEVATGAGTEVATEAAKKSVFEYVEDVVKNGVTDIKTEVGKFAASPVGYVADGFGDKVTEGIQAQGLQALDLVDKPQADINNQFNAFVPSIDNFAGSQEQYGASEIMSARAFEQEVILNPNQYGYTAYQYNQQMAKNTA